MMTTEASLLVLLGLGAAHGINPAMGWLFAVGLGLQEQDRRAVWRALGPIGLGHALAVGAVVALATAAGLVVPPGALRWVVAAALIAFGVWHLTGHRHTGRGGMKVSRNELVCWSFLMASVHGAGLMVLPFAWGADPHTSHASHLAAGLALTPGAGLLATGLHTAGYLVVTGLVAVIVYEKLGLRLLRTAWINLGMVWSGALVATALFTVLA
jgi:hypothetical protein